MAREKQSARAGSADPGSPGSSAPSSRKGVFRKEGEYWTIGHGGEAFRLKDTKGLGYLAHLLRHPTAEFHVLDLVGGIASGRAEDESSPAGDGLPRRDEDLEKAGIHITRLGDAGEMLDDQAKAAYRRRLTELREELDESKEQGKLGRAEQAEEEIDALTKELSRAVGLGGRGRRAASASERARQSITKTIKAVVERIAQSDAALGDMFARCIRTGTFCSYQPDPDFPIAWEFAAKETGSTSESEDQPVVSSASAPARADHQQSSAAVVLEISPFSLAERTAFAGRETERRAIRTAIDLALGGRGSLIMLGGGPGVGKSRLAMEMANYASRVGFRCLVGHCYEREEPFPYLPFVETIESNLAQAASLDDFRRRMGDNAPELAQIAPRLRRVFPDIPQPPELPPAQKRRYLIQSVAEALGRATQTRSYLYILEDLHWADESTLALLNYLANRVSQLPLVIVGTYREGFSDDNPALARTLEELIRIGIRPQKLGGLSRDAVAQMTHALAQRQAPESLVNLIFEESQGNPFFVEEMYRHLIEDGKIFDEAGRFRTDIEIDEIDVPENVRLIIGRRLERLDANEMRALAAAAVIGRSFSFQLLAAIIQIDVDDLFTIIEKAQQMGVIVPSAEGPEKPFTFAHELVRQTLLASISTPRRQRLHAVVADAIERLDPGAVERAGEIADHLLKAGLFADRQRFVRWLTLAGRNALEAAAYKEARRSFRSALSYPGAIDARERADLLASLALAERGLEGWDAALANLREALNIYIDLDDRKMIGEGFIELTDAFIWAGRFQEAVATARRGLAYLGDDVSADRVRLLAALGHACAPAEGYEQAHEALREALNIASEISDPKLVARVLGARSVANFHYFRLSEAAADGLLGEQLAGSAASPWLRAIHLRILYQTLLCLGRLDEAAKIADELEPLARKIGQSYSVALCLDMRAWIEFGKAPDLGKLDADLRDFSKAAQVARFSLWRALSGVQQSLVDFFRGDWTSALARAQACVGPEPGSSIEGYGVGTLFRQMAYTGDRDGALAILDEKRTWLPLSGRPNTRGSWLMLALVIEGLAMLGEHSQAGQFYPLICELLGTGAIVLLPICRFTQTIAGIAAASARQWAAAEDHLQTALQQAESFPHRLEQAEIRRFEAMMMMYRAAPNDRERARTLLGESLESYQRIGMARHVAMLQCLLN
jgi:tetratricopeptide (TPR) repeat protein